MSTQQFQIDFERRLPVSAQIGMATCDANADDRWKRELDVLKRATANLRSKMREAGAEDEQEELRFA